ncbi:ABC transporter ATP-binding protein [Bifidobacterium magnum]|uniref:ABC transporter, ATP-binding protein n=1 Tax=Bifidobacterium magnum TaxID=1692 RepID=A0A087BE59_9BIFI|nr:ABC transporter ATP-binding protein [Bifidobacterium magnum]KFI69309.1 ABC transporter, ATP-binding protein [Bifidobacterium magnum]
MDAQWAGTANPLLSVRGLCKRYADFALDHVDLCVPAGAIVGLVGVNGSGKTTLMKCVLGLAHADAGSIELFGRRLSMSEDAAVTQSHERMGVVFDTLPFMQDATATDIGKLLADAYREWDGGTYMRLLHAFNLPQGNAVHELSRGMGMKLQVACALSHHASLLMLDEPTAGLDPLSRNTVLDTLAASMTDSTGMLITSHITTDLERLADYIVCIDAGHVVFAVEKSQICDIAGIAHCRAKDVETVASSGFYKSSALRTLAMPMETMLLVPDRFAFARQFPGIPVEHATLDAYINLMLEGSAL